MPWTCAQPCNAVMSLNPHQPSGVGRKGVGIQKWQQPATAIAPTHCPDSAHLCIGKARIEVVGTVRIRPTELPRSFEQPIVDYGRVACRADMGFRGSHLLGGHKPRGSSEENTVARLQRLEGFGKGMA